MQRHEVSVLELQLKRWEGLLEMKLKQHSP